MTRREPDPELEFSFPVDVSQLLPAGRDYEITAKDAERKRIADRLDLLEVKKLTATIHVGPEPGGLVEVSGTVQADVVQRCIVTLDPIPATIVEKFQERYSREPQPKVEDLDLSSDDELLDYLSGETLDLGELTVEQLALFLDPYPRVPGAVFKGPPKQEPVGDTGRVSPFAVLAKLKTSNKSI
ncbi:MAG: DUF177 domain-containing protein [Rhodospirillaceae bacterium]|nr:DUF177 domain-containing protein [Rhodospirillaceae bacterium]